MLFTLLEKGASLENFKMGETKLRFMKLLR